MSFRSRFGSGFPFDDNEDRGLRARLAERHPEFAEHLNPETWGRARTGSGSSTAAGDDPFARFRNRARFQDFAGFPFDEFDDPLNFERYYPQQQADPKPTQQPQSHPQEPQQQQAQPQQHEQSVPAAPTHSKPPTPPAAPDSGKKKIQQSSTVDLGQPQPPLVDETRTHRSMSAPPEHPNRTSSGKQRYVSSVNIPNVNADKMGGSASQPQAPSKEHIIPIHIEGRDEVVMPSTAAQQQAPQPQPERIFGQRPGIFTKYVNPQEGAQDDLRHQEDLRRQQQQQKYQEFMRQQQQQQQQAEPPQQQPQAPAPPKSKPTSLELIQNIQKGVSDLMTQVENFDGMPRDKKYLYLDEMLTRKMLQLDDIETGGQDAIRKARKEAIKCIQDTIKVLENKAAANEINARAPKEATPTPAEQQATPPVGGAADQPTEVQPTPAEAPPTTEQPVTTDKDAERAAESQELLVGGVVRSGSQVTPMDVDAKADQPADERAVADAPPTDDAPPKAGETTTEGGATEKKRVKKKAEKK